MSRRSLSIVLLLIVVLALTACRRAGDVAELPTPASPVAGETTVISTIPALTEPATGYPVASPANTNTPSPIPPTAAPPTMTPIAATAVPATATPDFGPPPGGSARITFAPGATSAVVRSTLANAGDTDTWILRVMAGQVVTVQTISSAPGAIEVRLSDMSGGVLATNPDTVGITAAVPATGDYQLSFSTPNAAPQVTYTAQVFIPAAAGPVIPTRITFAPGATSAQLDDALAAGGDLNTYVLTVGAGQGISVAVFGSVPAVTNINIRNSAGQQVAAGTDMSGVSATATTAGDYFIDVSSGSGAPALTYRLTVTVPPISQPPPPPQQPVRITFGPGQTSAFVEGQITPGVGGVQYVIHVLAGQTIIANVNDNPTGNVEIAVLDTAATLLNLGQSPTSLATFAPANGDYVISLNTPGVAPVYYALEVVVPPLPQSEASRITFAPGATSATVAGDLGFAGDVDNWVIHALAGQTMHLFFGTSQTGWISAYVYNAAGDIIALGGDLGAISAPLAANGDYRIVVNSLPGAPALSYSMTVEIP
jgi:hypothetical protein